MAKLSTTAVQDENAKPRAAARTMKQSKIYDSDDDAYGGGDGDFSFGGGNDGGDSDFELDEAPAKKRKPAAKAATGGTAPKKPRKTPATGTAAAKKKAAAALQTRDTNTVISEPGNDSLESLSAGGTPEPAVVNGGVTQVSDPSPKTTPKKTTGKKSASDQYQRLSQLEHVLKRPDTYIGSVEHTEVKMWVFDQESQAMRYKQVTICPGLFKIFDEILVNAADNKIRDPSMDTLKVEIDQEKNTISVYNNGKGIPIEMHEKEKMYIPELIFGNLLTSSNYDDNEKKVTGGRNGYGAKVSTRGCTCLRRLGLRPRPWLLLLRRRPGPST
ncbi:DNA topoisomerase 2 [Sugiyamaella lignohabitans]|uniref:DNA topoisomerase (ATP-hydrolyzing) n=1 Tax=Sugiyamaella lignohabitans TaxID=796027 RepID=A0A167CGT3_9ASCO|nr:DNA topoisomerase 2 [Sugiyamaella lignohabitans]ANB11674.1 DNA topoisomerase 2 [Sugiyamaella lignohabitans]